MIDFTEFNKLSKNKNSSAEIEINRVILKEPYPDPLNSLQYKSDLNKKKAEFYKEILNESQSIRDELRLCVSTLVNMIELQVPIIELFTAAFFKLLKLSKCSNDVMNRIRMLALEKNNETARVVAYEDVSILLNNMKKAYSGEIKDEGAKIRLENAIKKHENYLEELSRIYRKE